MTAIYTVQCTGLTENLNKGEGPFSYIAHFAYVSKPEVQLQIAALPKQYIPGTVYNLTIEAQ